MKQLEFPGMLGRIDGAKPVPHDIIAAIPSYREAVRMCHAHGRTMTNTALADRVGLYDSHVSDYLNQSAFVGKKKRRNLPGEYIPRFQAVLGNTIITQWQDYQNEVEMRKLAEEMEVERRAA